MKWLGINCTTPTDDTPGAMETASNLRMKVDGEIRRRRGTARTSLAKASGAITAIADFALSPSNPYALTYISGSINGDQGITSQWEDVALSPISGSSSPTTGTTFSLTLSRGTSKYATSFLVFANAGSYPTDQAPGYLVGEAPIEPWETSASLTYAAPASGTWYFRAYPVRDEMVGPGANLTPSPIPIADDITVLMQYLGVGYSTLTTSAPIAYVTGSGTDTFVFDIGGAAAAGLVTLPYVFTITSSLGGPGGFIPVILGISTTGIPITGSNPKILAAAFIAGVVGTVTVAADLTVSIA